jgi:hypothetical protein
MSVVAKIRVLRVRKGIRRSTEAARTRIMLLNQEESILCVAHVMARHRPIGHMCTLTVTTALENRFWSYCCDCYVRQWSLAQV